MVKRNAAPAAENPEDQRQKLLANAVALLGEMEAVGPPEDAAAGAKAARKRFFDPLREDPRAAASGEALVNALDERIEDLEWRIAARDRQARIMALKDDLTKSADAVYAAGKADEERKLELRDAEGPIHTIETKLFLARFMARCDYVSESELDHPGKDARERANRADAISRLAHNAVHLARLIDQLGTGSRHTVRVERGP